MMIRDADFSDLHDGDTVVIAGERGGNEIEQAFAVQVNEHGTFLLNNNNKVRFIRGDRIVSWYGTRPRTCMRHCYIKFIQR